MNVARDPDYPKVHTSSSENVIWKCRKCKRTIGDSNYDVKIETKDPQGPRSRIICKDCKTENFVSHA